MLILRLPMTFGSLPNRPAKEKWAAHGYICHRFVCFKGNGPQWSGETMNVVWTSRDISIMDCIQVSCVEVGRLQINKTLSSFSFVFRLTCNPRIGTKPSCGHKHAFSYVQLHWLIVFNLHFVILSPPQKNTYNINQHHSRIQCFPFDTCKGLPKTSHEPSPWRRSWSYVVSPKGW